MPFDPNIPVNGTPNDADPIRANFNVLNARADALAAQDVTINQRIDNIQLTPGPQGPQGIPGNDGAPGPQGPQGEPGPNPFPWTGEAEINGNIKNNGMTYTGGVGIGVSDAGGSGETGILIGADSNTGILLPIIAIRGGGSTVTQLRWDIGGQIDGMGTPTLQDGAIYRVDLMSGSLKPWNVTVETIYYMDHNGNPQTKQVLVPPP